MATLAHPLEILPVLEPIDRVLCNEEEAVARAHRAAAPLLVARRDHAREGAAPQFLVAVEEGREALGLVRYAAMLAAGCGGYVHLAHVRGPAYGPDTRRLLAELSLEVIAITGAEPIVDVLTSTPVATSVLELAERCASSVLVIGRKRPAAARSLGCVSEALVRDAPCSVLVVPAS